MDLTRSTQAAAAKPAQSVRPESSVRTEVRSDLRNDVRSDLRNAVRKDASAPRKFSGYGLPCANCRLYYPADLDVCPACNSDERVSARVVPATPKTQVAAEPLPDDDLVEQEREAFLKEFKSQLYAAHAEVANSPGICALGEHHAESAEEELRSVFDKIARVMQTEAPDLFQDFVRQDDGSWVPEHRKV